MLSNNGSRKNRSQKSNVTGRTAPVTPTHKQIDVSAFLHRTDIPEDAKIRVRFAGHVHGNSATITDAAAAQAWRLMQAQVLIELAALRSREAENAR
jgi:hypothetical protein